MSWTLSDTQGALSVSFTPVSGSVKRQYEKPTGVFYPLRGSTPVIQYGPTRLSSIETPQWFIQGSTTTIVALLSTGHRLALTDDTGSTRYVKVVGQFTVELQDTPDRATSPKYLVSTTLVEVA